MIVPNRTESAIRIDRKICGYCGSCVSTCPEAALVLADAHLLHDAALCSRCLTCVYACPVGAMSGVTQKTAAATETGPAPGIGAPNE